MIKLFLHYTSIIILFINCVHKDENAALLNTEKIDKISITVTKKENRPVSFTNKKSAYYYTQSHLNDHLEHTYFQGLTIAQDKIFEDYQLFVNNKELDRQNSTLEVFPHKIIRKYTNNELEEFWMFDQINAVEIKLSEIEKNNTIGLKLQGVKYSPENSSSQILVFTPKRKNKIQYLIGVSSLINNKLIIENDIISCVDPKSYFLAVGKSLDEIKNLTKNYQANHISWKNKRISRLIKLLDKNSFVRSDVDSLQLALNWLVITTDQLITHQHGYGIYAGLPWFAEYWGRDQFIALPGACLVTGNFSIAKKILLSFAKYQNTDPNSKFYGRVPNIVKPNEIDYHTTDGTPRFVIQLHEYVKYSGDKDIINQLYPNVKHSIEGSLKNWIDKRGYLLHADNETWMDARRDYDKMPYSPRGTRANDIQALWYEQLMSGVYFAKVMNDSISFKKWYEVAKRVKNNFEKNYTNSKKKFIADRLNKYDKAEYKLRPNQLFTFELIDNLSTKLSSLKICWEELVYPWGTASLDRYDKFFHPFHLHWKCYHKDEAYHNGTIWQWLNGIAMQRMLEFDQTETAYTLFKNLNKQVLNMGVVGGIGENMDAYPHKGKQYPKLTGTYLQAWSNAEQLRIWHQYFLGIQPDLINNVIKIAPRIPNAFSSLKSNFIIGEGMVKFRFEKNNDLNTYFYEFKNLSSNISVDFSTFDKQLFKLNNNNLLKMTLGEKTLSILIFENKDSDKVLNKITVKPSPVLVQKQNYINSKLKDVKFCYPLDEKNHPVLNKKFNRDKRM